MASTRAFVSVFVLLIPLVATDDSSVVWDKSSLHHVSPLAGDIGIILPKTSPEVSGKDDKMGQIDVPAPKIWLPKPSSSTPTPETATRCLAVNKNSKNHQLREELTQFLKDIIYNAYDPQLNGLLPILEPVMVTRAGPYEVPSVWRTPINVTIEDARVAGVVSLAEVRNVQVSGNGDHRTFTVQLYVSTSDVQQGNFRIPGADKPGRITRGIALDVHSNVTGTLAGGASSAGVVSDIRGQWKITMNPSPPIAAEGRIRLLELLFTDIYQALFNQIATLIRSSCPESRKN